MLRPKKLGRLTGTTGQAKVLNGFLMNDLGILGLYRHRAVGKFDNIRVHSYLGRANKMK